MDGGPPPALSNSDHAVKSKIRHQEPDERATIKIGVSLHAGTPICFFTGERTSVFGEGRKDRRMPHGELAAVMGTFRNVFLAAAAFSLAVSMLLIVPSL